MRYRHRPVERRKESRYSITDRLLEPVSASSPETTDYTTGFTETARSLFVGIGRPTAPDSCELYGRVLDLSPSGTRLSVGVPFRLHERIVLTIPRSSLCVEVTAKISWLSVVARGELHIGCAFESQLFNQTLAQLAKAGFLERRREERHPTSIVAYASRESDTQSQIRVHMENFSAGGLALFSPRPVTVDEHLTLRLPSVDSDDVTIAAIVARQDEIDGGYLVGCRLVNKQDYYVICRIAPAVLSHRV